MKFLYVTDMHGDPRKYEKSLEIAKAAGVDLIVNGGDMLPKKGDRLSIQPSFIENYLPGYFKRLQDEGITYLNMLANDDLVFWDKDFEEVCDEFDNVHNINRSKVDIGGYEFIGMNNILDGPFRCKDRVVYEEGFEMEEQVGARAFRTTEDGIEEIRDWEHFMPENLELMKDIMEGLPEPKDYSKAVYITHMPPARLHLGELRRVNKDVGSEDIRRFIEERQPLLTLHGHIHEGPFIRDGVWKTKLGETVCIQPGQTEFGEDTMLGCLIDLDNKDYEWISFQV